MDPEERIKLMLQQFDYIYQNDPALRKLLGGEISKFSVEEKIEIMRAYMEGGGVQGLMDNDEELANMEIDQEEEMFINEAFEDVYKNDPNLRKLLGENVH